MLIVLTSFFSVFPDRTLLTSSGGNEERSLEVINDGMNVVDKIEKRYREKPNQARIFGLLALKFYITARNESKPWLPSPNLSRRDLATFVKHFKFKFVGHC